jgi:predicted nucleic acid-binding protein
MILADTSVWIDHFRLGLPQLNHHLNCNEIVVHPFVVTELALGSLKNRGATLRLLERLPQARQATVGEVRNMIEAHLLHSRGIGLVDAFLIASVLLTPSALLWTKDQQLRKVAESLGIDARLP